ncbi:MAG: hypothetical protein VB016_03850 [Methanomassiliicoccaceae archaeon]|nr:hypothetical protein [Methanomassiliicoccaceae archaeon]
MSHHPESVESVIESYCIHLRRDRRVKARFIESYKGNLHSVMIRLEAGGCETLPWLIDRKTITYLLDCFDRDKLAVKTRRGYIAAISGLMKFYGNSTINEMYIRWPHDSQPNVDWLSPSEARTLANYHFAEPLTNLLVHCELCLGMRASRSCGSLYARSGAIPSGSTVKAGSSTRSAIYRTIEGHRRF